MLELDTDVHYELVFSYLYDAITDHINAINKILKLYLILLY
jgi:hypothetical protein